MDDVLTWVLEGDPAVRWTALRDLSGASDRTVARERRLVAEQGWGARLLAAQNPDGGWGEGIYSPKWTSTTYTLLRLVWLGLPAGHPSTGLGCERLWEWAARWRVPETCVAAILVRVTSAHGHPADGLDDMVRYLLDEQLDDGGWNCATHTDKGKHSSFHTSIQALEALAAYSCFDGAVDVGGAVTRGREFFLAHKLYQSHRTGEVAVRGSTRLRAFPEWHFDVLRGLEYFAQSGAERDERLRDAVEVVRRQRRADGRWPVHAAYPGKQWFEAEPPGPSRWNTGRVLRVLRWWDGGPVQAPSDRHACDRPHRTVGSSA